MNIKTLKFFSIAPFLPLIFAQSATSQQAEWAEAHLKISQSLVYLTAEGYNEQGNPISHEATGIIINPAGVVLTVKHWDNPATSKPENIAVEGSSVRSAVVGAKAGTDLRPIENVELELGLDLQLVQLPRTLQTYTSACLDLDEPVKDDELVATSGFPSTAPFTENEGKISTLASHTERPLSVQTNMEFTYGQSGSPVYRPDGKVIGIALGAAKGSANINYFMPLRNVSGSLAAIAECDDPLSDDTNQDPAISLSEEQLRCIKDEYSNRLTRSFSVEGSVRCPGGGCSPFESGSCNHRSSQLSYEPPGEYRIESYRFVATAENDANNGPLQIEQDDLGAKRVSILLRCTPSSRIGAGGGWSSGRIEGEERYINDAALAEEVQAFCGVTASASQN